MMTKFLLIYKQSFFHRFAQPLLYLPFIILLMIFVVLMKRWFRKSIPAGCQAVPTVSGNYFYVGHGLTFSKDIIGFVRQCYEKYGKIFKIKIFRFSMVVICDRGYASEFYKVRQLLIYNYEISAYCIT